MKITFKIILLNLFLTTSVFAQDDEFGIASYYSDLFQGKPTASGELYDKGKMTAAHKTLPFGTMVKVIDLESKKAVQVRVNDRGPFISGRIIEISRAAANSIGLVDKGVSRVRVEIVKPASEAIVAADTERPEETPTPANQPEARIETTPTPAASIQPATTPKSPKPAKEEKVTSSKLKVNEKPSAAEPAPKKESAAASKAVLVTEQDYAQVGLYEIALKRPEAKGFGVQVASLTSQNALFKKIAELQGEWFESIIVNVEKGTGDQMLYKVVLGSFETRGEAKVYQDNLLKNKKIDGFVVDLASFGANK
ncbi:MAG: septal ring lytic transglycosylase RlpA family protein [Bacteroidota bacterium]